MYYSDHSLNNWFEQAMSNKILGKYNLSYYTCHIVGGKYEMLLCKYWLVCDIFVMVIAC